MRKVFVRKKKFVQPVGENKDVKIIVLNIVEMRKSKGLIEYFFSQELRVDEIFWLEHIEAPELQ